MLPFVSIVLSALVGPPRVVFTDCDGTMLQPDHTLSDAASEMLHKLDAAGVRVVPATGRARAGIWTKNVLDAHPVLKNGNPGVYINGCSAFDEDGKPLSSTLLPETVVRSVLDWYSSTLASDTMALVAYVGGEALYERGPRALYDQIEALGDSPPRQVESIPPDQVFKMILVCNTDDEVQQIRPSLSPLVAGTESCAGGQLTQALPGYLEIVPSSASKATACAALLERWGLEWADAVTIGDGSNDLPMLEAARRGGGTSIAMGNAGSVVKSAAAHVVGSNAEDGWVDAMERHVLSLLSQSE